MPKMATDEVSTSAAKFWIYLMRLHKMDRSHARLLDFNSGLSDLGSAGRAEWTAAAKAAIAVRTTMTADCIGIFHVSKYLFRGLHKKAVWPQNLHHGPHKKGNAAAESSLRTAQYGL